jgi:ABC-2 type transport system ATP-binding protein
VKIEINDAVKRFKEHVVLNHISLEFESGKIHGLIGRNGSGKTMLLKSICGFVPLTSGSICVDGKTIGKDIDMPESMGIIIEAPGFLPQYSAYKNLKLLAIIKGKIAKDAIVTSIKQVGLDPMSRKRVGRYSLGMRQRLGMAQAIMEDPDILLLDEPMNGLDNSGVDDIRVLLQSLRGAGKTIVLASHSRDDIDILCDTVTELDNGFIISTTTTHAPVAENAKDNSLRGATLLRAVPLSDRC